MLRETRYKYEEVAERIRRKIVSGEYVVGKRIPPIRDLAELYGINPQTVNKATAYLGSLGYLVSRQGSGSVAAIPEAPDTQRTIPMLVDRRRSELLQELDSVNAYHCKDIYLTYMLEAKERGVSTEFVVFDEHADSPSDAFLSIVGRSDGFVVQGDLPQCYFDVLAERDIPVALINRSAPAGAGANVYSLIFGQDGFAELINYVVSMGHDRLLFVLSEQFERGTVYHRRLETVRRVAEGWRPARTVRIEPFAFDPERPAGDDVTDLIEAGYTCAIGFNDISALAFYSRVHQLGLAVPGDMSVAGFDDILAARLASPPLTTVRVDRADVVRRALRIVEEHGESVGALSLSRPAETRLILRKSVAPPR